MERETAMNHCVRCDREFLTLADEKDDTCGNCHQEIYNEESQDDNK